MSGLLDRFKRLAFIVTKAEKQLIEDEENPAYQEADNSGAAVGHEDTGVEVDNLEKMFGERGKKRTPKVHYDMNNPEHRKLIREKLLKERQDKQNINDFRNTEIEFTDSMAVAKYRKLLDELKQNESARAAGQKAPFMENLIHKEIEELAAKFPDIAGQIDRLEQGDAEFNSRYVDEDGEEYDRANDEEKNQQALNELGETLEGVEGKGRDGANKRKEDEIGVDDVLVLADTMYTLKEAKHGSADMSMEDLKKSVMEKARQLGLIAVTKEERIAAYLSGKLVLAAEDEDEDEEETEEEKSLGSPERPIDKETAKDYRLYKKMPLAEKISGASYVQLYALNKYFSKLLKAKQKNEGAASAEEDESINPEELHVPGYNKKPPVEHGKVKRFTPEEIAKYEQMSAARASSIKIRFSVRE